MKKKTWITKILRKIREKIKIYENIYKVNIFYSTTDISIPETQLKD